MKEELKKVGIYLVVILLIIISWIADACSAARDTFAKDICNPGIEDCVSSQKFLPMTINKPRGYSSHTDVSGKVLNRETLIPKVGIIVRLAEIYCEEGKIPPTPRPTPTMAPTKTIDTISAPILVDGIECIFALDVAYSPATHTNKHGKFVFDSVPYWALGYVMIVTEGDPRYARYQIIVDSEGMPIVWLFGGSQVNVGIILIDF